MDCRLGVMFEFREIQLNDRDWISECLQKSDFRGCEYSFANNMAWRRLSDTKICKYGEFYISRSLDEDGKPYFTFPTGVEFGNEGIEKYKRLFAELKEYADSLGVPLKISSVNAEHLKWMNDCYSDGIEVTSNRDSFDYIYNACDLIELKGKRYHGKRNHIKRFKENNWNFELIEPDHFDECITFAAQFYNDSNGYDDYSAVIEQYAINTFFENFEYLGLKGGILRKDDKIVGFTIGEPLNSDTFVVHIEKARSDVQGAYPTLCNEFAKACADNFRYINREEDLGIEGLRKSKKSYNPEFLLEKYTVEFK